MLKPISQLADRANARGSKAIPFRDPSEQVPELLRGESRVPQNPGQGSPPDLLMQRYDHCVAMPGLLEANVASDAGE